MSSAQTAMKTLSEHHELVKFVIFWLILPIMAIIWVWFLLHIYPKLGQFAWQMFTDANGKPGWGRIGSWFALNMVFLWITHIVWKTEKIPDLWGPLIFVAGLYAIEKLPEIAAALRGVQLPPAKVEQVQQQP